MNSFVSIIIFYALFITKIEIKDNNYSKQKINTLYFIQVSEYGMIMHANIQYDNMHRFL
jgi:hypothetical protein